MWEKVILRTIVFAILAVMMPLVAFTGICNGENDMKYTVVNSDEVSRNNLCLDKQLLYVTEEGKGTIRLEVNAFGKVQINSIPGDIVFVLDQSGTMQETLNGKTKMQALKESLAAFVEKIYDEAKGPDGVIGTNDDVPHRVAVVGFANPYSAQHSEWSYADTEILTLKDEEGNVGVKYSDLSQEHYENALKQINTKTGKSAIDEAVSALATDTYRATYTDLGMEIAESILERTPDDDGRSRMVVVFTDGQPGAGEFDVTVANNAISKAKDIKSSGTEIYTIGLYEGTDGSDPHAAITQSNINKFMHLLSSNYLNASSMDVTGDVNNSLLPNETYFYSVDESRDIYSCFQTITKLVSNTYLGEEAVVKDVMSEYFVVDSDRNIMVYEAAFKGLEANGEKVWGRATVLKSAKITVDENGCVYIRGFDFDPVAIDDHGGCYGKKLIVDIPVNVNHKKLIGTDELKVPSNNKEDLISGVYNDEEICAEFGVPYLVVNDEGICTENTDSYLTPMNGEGGKEMNENNIVHTGDSFNVVLFVSIAAVSVLVAVAVSACSRKRRKIK